MIVSRARLYLAVVSVLVFGVTACSSAPATSQNGYDGPVAPFLMPAEFDHVRLSPDGKYLAVAFKKNGRSWLSVVDREHLKPTMSRYFPENYHVGTFFWVTPTRIVYSSIYSEGYLIKGYGKQVISAVDFDGNRERQLFPETSRQATGSIAFTGKRASFVTEKLVEDRYLMIEEVRVETGREQTTDLRKIDVFTGADRLVDTVDIRDGQYCVDNQFRPRIAIENEVDNSQTLYVKDLVHNRWLKSSISFKDYECLGFDKSNDIAYFYGFNRHGMEALNYVNVSHPDSLLERKVITGNQGQSLDLVAFDRIEHEPIYSDSGFGRPDRVYLSDSTYAKTLRDLDTQFPQDRIYVVDHNRDEILLWVSSAAHPSYFYIYNFKAEVVKRLISTNPKITPEMVSEPKLVWITARDGLKMPAYLTLPKEKPAGGTYPFVLYVHGGPFGVKEDWAYNGHRQELVSKGYALLQVNYRGSGGMGSKFEEMGYGKQGLDMQNDLADAAHWAIKEGYAAPKQIAVWGISYGGYSAAMSAMRFPELYACAASFGGVYNFVYQEKNADYAERERMHNLSAKHLPSTESEMLKQSPISHVADLKIDLLMGHGTEDSRVPVGQAHELRDALKKAGKKFEYYEYPNTGHWFTDPVKETEFFGKLEAFLDAHLKPKVAKN